MNQVLEKKSKEQFAAGLGQSDPVDSNASSPDKKDGIIKDLSV